MTYITPEFRKKFADMIEHKMNGEWDQYHTLQNELLEMMGMKP